MRYKIFTICLVLLLGFSSAAFAIGVKEASIDWKQFAGTKLNIMGLNVPYINGLKPFLLEFEKLTGMELTMESGAERVSRKRTQLEMAAQTGSYDVVYYVVMDSIPWIEAGWVVPVDEFVKDKTITDPQLLALDDFSKAPMFEVMWKGKLFSLPAFSATVAYYYRKDVFEKFGIKKVPETIDEFVNVASKIHTKKLPAVALRGLTGINLWHAIIFIRGMGGKFYKDYPNDMHPTINTPEFIRGVQVFGDLCSNYGFPGIASANWNEVVIAMQQGRAAMAIEGAPLAGQILDPKRSKVVGKLGFATVPKGPAGRFPSHTAHGMLIPKAAKNQKAAWLFIQWATSTEIQKKVALSSRHLAVTRNSVWTDPEFISKWDLGGGFLEVFQKHLNSNTPFHPYSKVYPQVRERVGQAVNEVIVRAKTAEKACMEAQKDVDNLMKKGGFY